MLELSERVPRAVVGLLAGVSLVALTVVACGDDGPEEVAPQAQQEAAADVQEAQQAQPIDAAEQESAQQEQAAQAAQPDAQSEPSEAEEDPAEDEPAEQSQETEDAISDPNRDTLNDGEFFNSSIGPDETEKLFKFQAATGAWLRIFVDGKGGMDPVVTLLQPDGVEVGVNDDLSTTNRDSLLIAQVPVEGLQLIRVQPFDSNGIGDFVIQVQTVTVGSDDDNAIMAVGTSTDGRLNTPGDVDVFEFQAEVGQQLFVLVDGDTGVDVFTQLFQPDGNLLQIDDDGGHGLDSEIYFTAETAGLWRVEVWPASNKAGQRQLIGAYRITVEEGLPTSAVNEAVASDLAGAALTFLQALRDGDSATILALAGPEALTIWGWDDAADVGRDIQKIQSIDLGDEILQSVSYGDVLHSARGRVYFQFSESDWMRMELIQLGGHWLVDDWAHSIGPPS
ncbi:MAG: PPC domain-containing protein [Chloroflexota bacterium]|nr:PPC domain-containing protein [Chloroflexota bacterium]